MVSFIFKMIIVERGQEALWRGRQGSGFGARSVGRSELIEAHDMEEAVATIKQRYPDCSVMREGSERICRAYPVNGR